MYQQELLLEVFDASVLSLYPGKNILQGFQDSCKKRDIFSSRFLICKILAKFVQVSCKILACKSPVQNSCKKRDIFSARFLQACKISARF